MAVRHVELVTGKLPEARRSADAPLPDTHPRASQGCSSRRARSTAMSVLLRTSLVWATWAAVSVSASPAAAAAGATHGSSQRSNRPPAPPYQTPYQQQLHARVSAKAKVQAAAATPALLAMLSAAPFRASLRACCPSIAAESASQLLGRLVQGLRGAELTHNFNANSTGQWEGDINISTAADTPWLPNLWEIMYLGQRAGAGAGGCPGAE